MNNFLTAGSVFANFYQYFDNRELRDLLNKKTQIIRDLQYQLSTTTQELIEKNMENFLLDLENKKFQKDSNMKSNKIHILKKTVSELKLQKNKIMLQNKEKDKLIETLKKSEELSEKPEAV